MEELQVTSINLHLIFIGAMILVACLNLYFILKEKNFGDFSKKVHFIAPQYYMIMAALLFTGLIAMGVNQMHVSLGVSVMIIAWFVIFILSMKAYKKYKKTRINFKDTFLQNDYRSFAKKKYIIDITLIILVSFFAYWVK